MVLLKPSNRKSMSAHGTFIWHIFSAPPILLYLWVFCLHVYLCTAGVPGAQEGQQRASDPLKLELQTVVSHYVSTGNQTWVNFSSHSIYVFIITIFPINDSLRLRTMTNWYRRHPCGHWGGCNGDALLLSTPWMHLPLLFIHVRGLTHITHKRFCTVLANTKIGNCTFRLGFIYILTCLDFSSSVAS